MYYSRHSSKHRGGFLPLIPIFFILFALGIVRFSPIMIFVFIIIFGKVILKGQKKSSRRRSSQPYIPRQSAYHGVEVNYTERKQSSVNKPHSKGQVYCYECGSGLDSNARFCNFCGTSQNI